MLLTFLRNLFLLSIPLFLFNGDLGAQCDVFIEQGSVVVTDNGSGVKFQFDVTNNSGGEWEGDVLKMFWSLNSSAPIWTIDYTSNNNVGPLPPGQTRTITTPWFDIPNLPSWFPEDPGPGGDIDDYWVEALEWPYWSANPNGFDGTWSQINLRLGSCGLGDGAWVYDDNGDPYYGPLNSDCPDVNNDAFCDCDVNFLGFDPETYDVSIEVVSHWNCGTSLNTSGQSSEMDYINMVQIGAHVPGWDYGWGCTSAQYNLGWTFDNPVSFEEFYAGDTINYNMFSDDTFYDDCFQEILESDTLTSCLEIVLWQINYSETAIIGEIDGGWAATCGICADQTQFYPDMSMELNSMDVCNAPPPLYPGCMDSEAENYDPNAGYDDGTCTYPPIFGCQDPIACNYNESATEQDDSCVYCDTPNGEELCNQYHGAGSNYWEFYSNIFDCVASPDAVPDLDFIGYECIDGSPYNIAKVTVKNSPFQGNTANDTLFVYCVEVPQLNLDTCLNGYINGVNWIEPGGGQLIWDSLLVPNDVNEITVNIYNTEDETDEELLNNTITEVNVSQDDDVCVILGCTDPESNNFNENANSDDGSCTYDVTELTYVGAECFVDCDVDGPYWYVITTWTNTGNVDINSFCSEWDVTGGQGDDVMCFNGNLQHGDTTSLQYGPYNVDVGLLAWAYVTEINGVTFVPPLENYETLYCFGEAQASCVYGCMDVNANNYNPDADFDDGSCTYPPDLSLDSLSINEFCDGFTPYWVPTIHLSNLSETNITEYCIKMQVLGQTNDTLCFSGEDINIDSFGNISLVWPEPIYSYGTVSIHVLDVNGESEQEWNDFGDDSNVSNNMFVTVVGNPTINCDVLGCIDETANNYNPDANVDDGSCTYDIYGCTDEDANNYNPNANVDDGSCEYDIFGCTDPEANNYEPTANVDDGSLYL